MGTGRSSGDRGSGAASAARLIPDLKPYPPDRYYIVHHPDVQLTPEEWLELADYEKMESDALVNPGVVGLMIKPNVPPVKVPLQVGAAKVHDGRGQAVRILPYRARSGGMH